MVAQRRRRHGALMASAWHGIMWRHGGSNVMAYQQSCGMASAWRQLAAWRRIAVVCVAASEKLACVAISWRNLMRVAPRLAACTGGSVCGNRSSGGEGIGELSTSIVT